MFSEETVQRYAKGLYPIAIMLMIVPLVDLTLRAMPPQFGTLQWRFATTGLLLGNFGTLLLGLGLIGLVAALSGHRTVLRAIGFVALALAAVTLAVLVLFALDAVQMRRLVNVQFKRQVLLSSLGAMVTAVLGMISLALVGRAALAASRPARTAPKSRPAARPLVVGGPGASEAV